MILFGYNQKLHIQCESEQDISEFVRSVPEKYGQIGGYIEVQLWSDSYLKDFI